jgi:hypothetical protein
MNTKIDNSKCRITNIGFEIRDIETLENYIDSFCKLHGINRRVFERFENEMCEVIDKLNKIGIDYSIKIYPLDPLRGKGNVIIETDKRCIKGKNLVMLPTDVDKMIYRCPINHTIPVFNEYEEFVTEIGACGKNIILKEHEVYTTYKEIGWTKQR